jgi:hypothetical protein
MNVLGAAAALVMTLPAAVAGQTPPAARGQTPAVPAAVQQPSSSVTADAARYTRLRADVGAQASRFWPGFRPDTIPLQLVFPGRGTMLIGWAGNAPSGYTPIGSSAPGAYWHAGADRGAASTATELDHRSVAQMVITDTAVASVAGLMSHEAFHAFQQSVRRDGVKFGKGENSYYVSQYPVFDVANETSFALELAVLAEGLSARTADAARAAARRFLSLREARHRAMDANVALFEKMTELNEGLAEYALVQASHQPGGSPAPAPTVAQRLETVLGAGDRSIRLRFYSTGAAQALLLDRLAASDWKRELMMRDVTLSDLLGEAISYRASEMADIAQAKQMHSGAAVAREAVTRVASLRRRVNARADSLLAVPGELVTIDRSRLQLNSCGFDPQNMLQLGDGAILHTRWLHMCGADADLVFNAAIVQEASRLRSVIGDAAAVRITAEGAELTVGDSPREVKSLKLESPGLTAGFGRAIIQRTGSVLTITPL